MRLGNSNENGATFNMYGGEISGNTARRGGAVCLAGSDLKTSQGAFALYGGVIKDNEAQVGGGIYACRKTAYYVSTAFAEIICKIAGTENFNPSEGILANERQRSAVVNAKKAIEDTISLTEIKFTKDATNCFIQEALKNKNF